MSNNLCPVEKTLSRDWCTYATGHVGAPLPCNIVKLVDVEEMNYFASNGEGEVRVEDMDFQ